MYLVFVHCVGILAGIRPCGVIVLFAELFTAESKSQVYAHLHELIRKKPAFSNKLGKHIWLYMYSFISLCNIMHLL